MPCRIWAFANPFDRDIKNLQSESNRKRDPIDARMLKSRFPTRNIGQVIAYFSASTVCIARLRYSDAEMR